MKQNQNFKKIFTSFTITGYQKSDAAHRPL
jgi:hypothetical protein